MGNVSGSLTTSIYDSGTIYKVVSVKPDATGAHDAVVNVIRSHSFRL